MKKLLAVLMLFAIFPAGSAMAMLSLSKLKTKLNQNVTASDGYRFRLGDQLTEKKIHVMKVAFDTSKTGSTTDSLKAVGAHALKDSDGTLATLPEGAIVKEAWLHVKNSLQANSAAPKLCFQVQGSCDLKLGQTSSEYSSSGQLAVKQILPKDGTTTIKLTADRIVYGIVTGGALTGGTMNLFIEYFLSE